MRRQKKMSRRIAAILLSVMLAAESGAGYVQAAELNQQAVVQAPQSTEAVDEASTNEEASGQESANGEAENQETTGEEAEGGNEAGADEALDTVSGAVPKKEVLAKTVAEEPQIQEDLEYVLGRPMTEEEKAEQLRLMKEYTSKLVPLEPDAEVDRIHSDEEEIAKATSIPSSYDARNNGWITPVKDQNPYGTCWAFSSINMAEASLIKKGIKSSDVDLSELHLAYYTYHFVEDPLGGTAGDNNYRSSGYLNVGGNYSRSSNAMLAWMGTTTEGNVPYSMATSELPATVASAYGQNVALLRNTREIHLSDISLVKQAIMDYGSVGIMYWAVDEGIYYNPETAAQYCPEKYGVNHAVSVVGWDDNYSASNFATKPSGNGAWLVKNSWSNGWGDKGYFWLSYEDATINNTVFAFEAMAAGTYDNNYFYDGSGAEAYYGMTGSMTAANVFTAHAQEGKKEILKAVSFALDSVNTNYSIQIYKNPSDAGNPESGTAMLSAPVTGTCTYEGYYTVDLNQSIELNYGDVFAVVVTLEKGNDFAYIGCEQTSSSPCVSTATALAGQSLYKYGGGWRDFGVSNNKNFKIKAYTVNTSQASQQVAVTGISMPTTSGKLAPGETTSITASVIPSNATNKKINWSSSDTSVATVDSNGKVTAVKVGTAVITAKTADGNYSAQYQLTVKEKSIYTNIRIYGTKRISYIGNSCQFSATVYPTNAPDTSVTWTTSNKNVVDVDNDGLVTATGIGTASITATANGDSDYNISLEVTVPDNNYNRVRSFVNRMYTVALNRPADSNGATYWTEQLMTGAKDGAAVAKGFVLSAEMERRNLTDSQFVDMLYKTFFDRAADANGKAYWMNLLANGVSRAYVFKGFCHSQEFTNICNSYNIERGTIKLTENRDQNHNITMYVFRCYERTLGRKPDVSGLNFWTGQILTKKRSPIDVAGNFVFSAEFKNKKLSDEEYVKVLYRMFFDREYNAPGTDPNGIKFWLNELKTGRRDRYKVFTGFANSQEFKSVLKTFGL